MAGRIQNLKLWPKGVSGNPGGRPKKRLITEVLEGLLEQEMPDYPGEIWATVIAKSLLKQAAKGDIRAISELSESR